MHSLVTSIILCLLLHMVKANNAKTIVLNDGNEMPVLAFGTYGTASDRAKMRQAVVWAMEAGYRHIDTAAMYDMETEVGLGLDDAFRAGLVKREEVYITTKLWNDRHAREQVVPSLQDSLKRLNLDYVDLYLIHFPVGEYPNRTLNNIDYLETWEGMQDALRLGLTRSIGVSNFNSGQISRIISNKAVRPAVNQIEVNPTLVQESLIKACRDQNVTVVAYTPFGFMVSRWFEGPPPKLDDPVLKNLAEKYKKTVGQVVLRWLIDRGVAVIVKSTNKGRILENSAIFDFTLSPEDVITINNFNKNARVYDGSTWKGHPYFPYDKD